MGHGGVWTCPQSVCCCCLHTVIQGHVWARGAHGSLWRKSFPLMVKDTSQNTTLAIDVQEPSVALTYPAPLCARRGEVHSHLPVHGS